MTFRYLMHMLLWLVLALGAALALSMIAGTLLDFYAPPLR